MKYLMKENSEMKNMMMAQNTATQNMMMDVIKTGTHNNTTNNNSHNKTFNLNFFLNETCKNALNINEFVSSIKVSLDDLENTGRQGYIEGISSIILNKLKNLNHYDRPIHCADHKREILYIKNDNQWFKETEDKPLLTKAIKTIANENIKQIKTWRDKNPECTDSDSKKNNLYLKIVSNSMSGTDKEECDKNINKIIKNIVKETIIDK
jgi:transcriptional regulator with PAS, ATPase and Fis domain